MPWRQLRDADMTVGYTGGWCLKYCQDAFKTDHPDPDATNAWEDNYLGGNHYDLPPVGKTVPVYFSLGNVPQGHVAISLDDGMIASSTQGGYHSQPYFHQNLDNIIWVYGQYNGGCNYLGWSEYVGTVHVVEWYDLVPESKPVPEPPVIVPPVVIPPVVVPEPPVTPEPPIVEEVPIIETPIVTEPIKPPVVDKVNTSWIVRLIQSIIDLINKIFKRR